jgi:hypothetical protein
VSTGNNTRLKRQTVQTVFIRIDFYYTVKLMFLRRLTTSVCSLLPRQLQLHRRLFRPALEVVDSSVAVYWSEMFHAVSRSLWVFFGGFSPEREAT